MYCGHQLLFEKYFVKFQDFVYISVISLMRIEHVQFLTELFIDEIKNLRFMLQTLISEVKTGLDNSLFLIVTDMGIINSCHGS